MTTLQEACVTALDALEQWAELIKHQYTGTKEGMTDLQLADNNGMLAIEALKAALAQPVALGLNPLWVATHPDGLSQPVAQRTK